MDRTFNDLELLLRARIPEEKEGQLFSAEKITKFAEALVEGPGSNASDSSRYPRSFKSQVLQTRRSQIALILAEIGLGFLISQYSLLSKRTPFLGQTAINELRHAVHICRDISDEIKSRSIESTTQIERTIHLFDWEMISGRHEHRLRDFLSERIKTLKLYNISEWTTPEIETFRIMKNENNEKEWYIVCNSFWENMHGETEVETFSFAVIIEIQDEKSALLRINELSSATGEIREVHREELIVQKENNNLHILIKEQQQI